MKQIIVGIGEYAASRGPALMRTAALGSCVAIVLDTRDRHGKCIGALAHVLLPHEALTDNARMPAKCPATALPIMLRRIRELGSETPVRARLVGGASMFPALLTPGALSLGARNVAAARAVCAAHDVAIVDEDTGGHHGRSVLFDVFTGDVVVTSVLRDDVRL